MATPNKGRIVAGASALVLTLAGAFVSHYEPGAHRNAPYWDPYGKVWTVCDGHTGDVDPKHAYTDAECDAFRDADLVIANAAVKRCLTMPMLVQIEAALTDGVYNLGPRLVCGSTLQRKAIANDWPGACAELYRWDRAGGRVLPGLTRRRTDEAHLCEGRALWGQQ